MNLHDLPERLRKVAAMYGQYLIPIAHHRKSVSPDKLYKVLDQVINFHVPERVLIPIRIQVQNQPYILEEQILLSIFSYQENILTQVPEDQMSPRVHKLHKMLRDMSHQSSSSSPMKRTSSFKETLLTILSSIESTTSLTNTFHGKKLLRSESCILRIDKEANLLQIISHEALETRLENDQEITVQEMLKVPTKDGIEELIQGPLILFFADRQGTQLIRTRIAYTDTLTTFNGDRFFLGAVIEDVEGCYRTFIRCEDHFMSTEGYKGPLPSSVSTCGLLYVYQPLYESIDDYQLKYWSSKDTLCVFPFTDTITDLLRLYKKIFLTVNIAKCFPTLRRFFKDQVQEQGQAQIKKGNRLTLWILNLSNFIRLTQHLNM